MWLIKRDDMVGRHWQLSFITTDTSSSNHSLLAVSQSADDVAATSTVTVSHHVQYCTLKEWSAGAGNIDHKRRPTLLFQLIGL